MLRGGLDAVEQATQQLTDRLAALDPAARAPAGDPLRPSRPPYLRPPGALPQPALAQTCSQCGLCVKACPAQCIQLDPDPAGVADHLPYIVPRQSPCVVCDDLACMKACPTGALQPLTQASDIRMGFAVMDHRLCLRGPQGYSPGGNGEDCRVCVNQCPLGGSALGIDDAGRVQVRAGCIGCGVCERACPTEPAAIFVVPHEPWR